ncbi:MAG: hypothetical protein RMJ07_04220 [Nitrososphaerota archaeon]|nr:hypothetical protein [Candidatus Bathyarchaeota archaeon]MDW8048869.1 hypothetical protein [Nitrososphaerota archaeon]
MKKTPLPVKLLRDYVRDWIETREGIVIHPKDEMLEELLLRPHYVFFLGEQIGWEFIAMVRIPFRETDTESIKFLEHLRNVRCKLTWHGIVRKIPVFQMIEPTEHDEAGSTIPYHDLPSFLNRSEELKMSVKDAKFSEMMISLLGGTKFLGSDETRRVAMGPYWLVEAVKTFMFPIEGLSRKKCRRDFIKAYDAISETSRALNNYFLAKLADKFSED